VRKLNTLYLFLRDTAITSSTKIKISNNPMNFHLLLDILLYSDILILVFLMKKPGGVIT